MRSSEYKEKIEKFKDMLESDIKSLKEDLKEICEIEPKRMSFDDQLNILHLQNKISAYQEILNDFSREFFNKEPYPFLICKGDNKWLHYK